MPLDHEHAFALEVAEKAGSLLLELRNSTDAAELGARGDRASHDHLLAALREHFPDDAVLSEEGVGDSRRQGSARVWIVDPLDGTREFGEPPRTDWAVHVALAVGGRPVVGAVAMPALSRTFTASPPSALGERAPGPVRIAVSRTRPPAIAESIASGLGATLLPMGSAGAKVAAVLTGEADAYVHAGGQWEWDSAAPVAVALAAGLHASRLDGSPLVYNQPRPWLPDLLVCRPAVLAEIQAAVREAAGAPGVAFMTAEDDR